MNRLSEEEKWIIQKKSMIALIKSSAIHCYASFFTPSLFYEMGLAITEPILKEQRENAVKNSLATLKNSPQKTL